MRAFDEVPFANAAATTTRRRRQWSSIRIEAARPAELFHVYNVLESAASGVITIWHA
jgi:hypothetical protein